MELSVDESSAAPAGGREGGRLRILWEPEPVSQPGVFKELAEAASYLNSAMEAVAIHELRLSDLDIEVAPGVSGSKPAADSASPSNSDGTRLALPPVMFYPDGSSDSFELRFGSTDEADVRTLAIKVDGTTGAMSRRWISHPESGTEVPSGAEVAAPFPEEQQAAPPPPAVSAPARRVTKGAKP